MNVWRAIRGAVGGVEQDPPLFDAAFARRLERLTVRTRNMTAWLNVGEHSSPRRAPSRDLIDFRAYSHGEDPRYVDWNTYARLGELVTRLGDVRSERGVHILLDTSGSMDYGNPGKFWYARRVAAALAYVSLRHSDQVSIVPFTTVPVSAFGPSRGRGAMQPLLRFLTELTAAGLSDGTASLRRYVRATKRAGALIVISDLLAESGQQFVTAALRPYLERDWTVSVIHVLAPEEVASDLRGEFRLLDVELGEELLLSLDQQAVLRYRAAVDRWLVAMRDHCLAYGAGYLRLVTDMPFEDDLARYLGSEGGRGARLRNMRLVVAS